MASPTVGRYGRAVATRSPSTAARRQLGAELRRWRDSRRAADVAAELGWSESKLSRIETARTGIAPADLEKLSACLGVPNDRRAELRVLAQRSRQRTWWSPYRTVVSDTYDEYVALEAEAVAMDEWEPQVVPGLLQTDEYARAVIEAGTESRDPDVVERRVALRMGRQAVLTRRPAPRLRVVLDEGALYRRVGGSGVMRRQLNRLVDAGGRDGVELRVLPFAAGVHAALAGAFTVFTFEDRAAVAHAESMTGGVLHTREDAVRVHLDAFDDLCARALDPDASSEFFDRISRSPEDEPCVSRRGSF